MTRIRPHFAAAAIALIAGPSAAGPLTELLKERQAKLDQVLVVKTAKMTPAQKEQVRDILAEIFDYRAMARDALGQDWDGLGDAEREAYAEAFTRMVRANSIRGADVYKSSGIAYRAETIDDEGVGLVETTVETEESLTEVSYVFREIDGAWRVVDFALDGVSTVRNYRSQFRKILRKEDMAGLIERLTTRADELEANS